MRGPAIIAIACALALSLDFPLAARIQRQVHPDGTVEYSNPAAPERACAAIDVSSRFDELIERIAARENADPLLVKCIVKTESDFNPNAVSPAGAMGLMQLMPEVSGAYRLGNPFDPEQNVTAGVRHFNVLMRSLGNDIPLALAAYHAGIGRVRRTMSVPPIRATVSYVNRIMNMYNRLSGRDAEDYEGRVRRLYMRLEQDGTIVVSN
jgi:soluble lytic murein transglycosylase-like protein